MFNEKCLIKGTVNLLLKDKDGNVKFHKTVRNSVTQYGLAHIIGRLIDTNQDLNESHIIPRMMSHIAIGSGDGGSDSQAVSSTIYDRMLENEVGTRVQVMRDTSDPADYNSTYDGVIESLSGHPVAAPGETLNPATDYGVTRGKIGSYYNTSDRTADPVETVTSGYSIFGTDTDGLYQGTVTSGNFDPDDGTTPEGYPVNENDYGQQSSPAAGTAVAGTKKIGNRIVFSANFKGGNPSSTTVITEAGIFNRSAPDLEGTFDETLGSGTSLSATDGSNVYAEKAGFTGAEITQTMLCRTTFNGITKNAEDSLQVTWSVQISEQSS